MKATGAWAGVAMLLLALIALRVGSYSAEIAGRSSVGGYGPRYQAGGRDPEIVFLLPAHLPRRTTSVTGTDVLAENQPRQVRAKAATVGLRLVGLPPDYGARLDYYVETNWHRWAGLLLELETITASRPESARFVVDEAGKPQISREQWGSRLDVKTLGERVAAGLAKLAAAKAPQGQLLVSVPVQPIRPAIVAADLQNLGISRLLSTFITGYDEHSGNRAANIRLAAAAVDGRVLRPGEEFSFNDAVGPRNVEQGYREAPVIVNDKLIPGLGGGICQVSTTLYNAALLAGLTVLERTPHSLPSTYVDLGRDATVAYGLLDLRLRNDLEHPVLISAAARDGMLKVSFYGPENDDKREVRVFVEREKQASTASNSPDASVLRVRLWREIWRAGGLVRRELISDDTYKERELRVL